MAAVLRLKGLSGEQAGPVAQALGLAYGQVYRAVAFDVDGTLTDVARSDVDRAVAEELAKLLRRGVPVVLITGRGRSGARMAARALWDTDELSGLSSEESAQIERRLRCVTHNGLFLLEAGPDGGSFLSNSTPLAEVAPAESRRWHEEIKALLAGPALLNLDVRLEPDPEPGGVRVGFGNSGDRAVALPHVQAWLERQAVPGLRLHSGTYGGGAMLDVGTADKGAALVEVARRLNVRPEAILRVGDQGGEGGNDHSLLANVAGFSVGGLAADPATCHPVVDDVGRQTSGAEAVRLLLGRVHLFPKVTTRPDWGGYARELARFERTATRHSRTQQGMLIRQVNVRLQSLLAHRLDGGVDEIRLADLFDARSGAVRLADWELHDLLDADPSRNPPFAGLFGLERLARQSDLDRGGTWCMHSDNSVLLRGPGYYRSLSGPREADAAAEALAEWAEFADHAATVLQGLGDRPDDPTLTEVKCVLGVMDNVRGALLQALVIALVLDGREADGALTAARDLVRDAALPHTRLQLGLLLDAGQPWQTLMSSYCPVLDAAAVALRAVQGLVQRDSAALREDRVELFKWREADHMLENVVAVEMGLRRLVRPGGDPGRAPWAVGLAYGGVELPLLAAVLGERAGRTVRPAVLRVSMYSNMAEGEKLRDIVLAASDQYLGVLDQQDPFQSLDPDYGDAGRELDVGGQDVLLLDDNATTATTLQVARDLALYRKARVLGACLVRYPSPNRVSHMSLQGHGALDLALVFNVVWGLVAASPYSRLVVPGTGDERYEDENGVFDKAKQRIKYLLRKNDPAGFDPAKVLPQPRLVPLRSEQEPG